MAWYGSLSFVVCPTLWSKRKMEEKYKNIKDKSEGYVCSDCGAEVSIEDEFCPECGANISEIEEDEELTADSSGETSNTDTYKSSYKTARGISEFVSFLGWLLFIVGIVIALVGFVGGIKSRYGGVSLIAMLPGLGTAVAGLLLVMGGQVTRATVDSADHTREIMNILREKA